MTDSRLGASLLPVIKRLPFGSGVVFRHYHLAQPERRKLFIRVRKICRQRGHKLILADAENVALSWRADGFHMRAGRRRSLAIRSAPVHNHTELYEALRNATDLLFISPIFATTSHSGCRPLGRLAFAQLAKQRRDAAVIALGGMNQRRAANIKSAYGWAGIDAFIKKQN